MKSRFYLPFVLGLAVSIFFFQPAATSAKAKHWTITDRQQALSVKVTAGEKSNNLTKKEADKLRKRLQAVNEHISNAKTKNGGQLSYKDQGKIEKELNGISVDLDKKELEKRALPK